MNIGSIFRIADALGVENIYLTGSSLTPPNSKIHKTSRATEKYVPFQFEQNALHAIDQLKTEHYRIICLEITSNSIAIENLTLNPNDKVCLILGSENKGVSQELLDVSDDVVHIPMLGKNSSMNVANACAIACYDLNQKIIRK